MLPIEHCPRCQHKWRPPTVPREHFDCPGCGTPTDVIRFAAALRESRTSPPASPLADASCYRHSSRRAVIVCSQCGRFACGLCQADLANQPLCVECANRVLNSDSRHWLFVSQLVQYDRLCLWIVLGPMLGVVTIGFTVFTAPLALMLLLFRWRQPMSVLPSSSFRRWLALLLAGGTTLGWLILIVWLIRELVGNLNLTWSL